VQFRERIMNTRHVDHTCATATGGS
jgi:hypothetical protein